MAGSRPCKNVHLDNVRSTELLRLMEEKLLQTAIDHFGRLGFDGTSTREIARTSGTAMSSITYHFGGKKGLFLAAADYIAEKIKTLQSAHLETASQAASGTPSESTEVLLMLLDQFALMMMSPLTEPWARFIVREQQSPTEAFERLYDGVMKQMIDTLIALIQNARPDFSDQTVRATAVMFFGQVLVLRVGQASVCRIMEIEAIDDAHSALFRTRIRAHVLAIIAGNRE